jgi:hypothetical protein
MKVYTCWSGTYSDRGIDAIFSTEQKAKKYLKIRKLLARVYDDIDDKPIILEVDNLEISIPEYVIFQAWREDDGKWQLSVEQGSDEKLDTKIYEDGFIYYIKVKYNKKREVMEKAVIDKVMTLYARDIGI